MTYRRRGDFDLMEYLSLGREVAERHKEFKFLAPLGQSYSRKRAIVEYWIWQQTHKDESLPNKAKQLIELLGMAEMLDEVKEIGRFCLILGDTRQIKRWE